MALLAPPRPLARTSREATTQPILVLVDIAFPLEPQLRRAVGLAAARGVSLRVALVHPRLGFSTDAAIVARHIEQLRDERVAVAGIVERLLEGQQVPYEVRLVPYARRPRRSLTARARRAAQLYARRESAQLVLAAPHLEASADRP